MPNEPSGSAIGHRKSWDRRRDLGRRIVRERRRETVEVPFERRSGTDRRSGVARRAVNERRNSPPKGSNPLDV